MNAKGNLTLWNSFSRPPKSALKTITGGRLKGMSDINPQWRYLALTEQFGPCGIGWKYTIDELWIEDGANGEKCAFARILLFVLIDGVWSDPIPGIGGSKAVEQEQKRLHSNDEAYKMAVTDALSTACKMLGVAADVYMGLWDGSKYVERPSKSEDGNARVKTPQVEDSEANPFVEGEIPDYPNVTLPAAGTHGINDIRGLIGHAQVLMWDEERFLEWVRQRTGKTPDKLTAAQAKALEEAIKKERSQ